MILLLTVALIFLIYSVSRFVAGGPDARVPVTPARSDANGTGSIDSNAAALPDSAATQAVIVERPGDSAAPAQPSPDARQPNRWYYVNVLGDGPGAIYSRTGGQWNFAFACTARARVIEFIAVGTGPPGDFDKQSIRIGKVRLMMDASYSPEGGGTIITKLPATHPFFNGLNGETPMEIQLQRNRKTIVPIGPDVVRLVKACRGSA